MRLGEFLKSLKFANPKKNRITILYSYDYWLRKLVLRELPATTLEMFPECIYVTPALIGRVLRRLHRLDWSRLRHDPSPREFLRQVHAQYVLACLDQVGAEIVLTLIDNSGLFQKLSRIDQTGRTYFAVQNGTRTLFCVRDSLLSTATPVVSMTNFFCFGQRDVDLFTRHGHIVDNYLPVGSLIGGYYKTTVSASTPEPEFDLCLISQWHEHFSFDATRNDSSARVGAGISGLNVIFGKLLAEVELSLVVCLRNENNAREVAFFKEAFGEEVRLKTADFSSFSAYRTAERSRMTIGLNSTMLAELFSWGRKVLWCNVPGDEHFEMPEAGVSYFEGNDYQAFRDHVLSLLAMPQEEYEAATQSNARYINNYDPANPPHEAIRAAILRAQGPSTHSP